MKTEILKLKVTKSDLKNYEKFQEMLQDYPLYASTSGLFRADMVLFAKLVQFEFGNDVELDISIHIKRPDLEPVL